MPELRFPEFKGPWKPARAGDAFRNGKAKGEAGLPIYSVTQDRGLVRRDSLERHMGADAADEANLRAQPGDLVYNMMRMWQGAVGMASEECMVSPAYVVLSPKKGVSSKFFDYWFQNRHMLHQLWAYSHGLTSDRLRLYYQDFAKIPLALPDQPEQEKIAAVLDATSRKITLLIDKKTALEDYKRGLMQRLFSRELRFTRDDGSAFPDWEERKLGKLITPVRGLSYSGEDVTDSGLTVLRSNNIKDKRLRLRDTVCVRSTVEEHQLVRAGDILLCANNGSRKLIGKSALIPHPAPRAAHGAFMLVLRGSENEFVFQLLQTDEFFRKVHQDLGAIINSINASALVNFRFLLPSSSDERRKIATVLSALDAKIDALSQKISEMETFKKGLLQKLFV